MLGGYLVTNILTPKFWKFLKKYDKCGMHKWRVAVITISSRSKLSGPLVKLENYPVSLRG